ncbi:MAG TPA: peptide-methionine (R)-S-oxide reductase MsrB [Allosphingosinicella sp.]|nr:peptide-methionine (R)-S-oxide reductase MsrB [Allosphingosinicella sp.]
MYLFSRRRLLGSGAAGVVAALAGGTTVAGAQPRGRFPFTLTDAQWRRRLSADAYAVLRREGTERPDSSPLNREHRRGTFSCAGCGQHLFSSAAKFDSGTGWPSFWQPLPGAIGTGTDRSLGTDRTEVHCARCGGHLGHVFNDGPRPTGLRYCMNGVAMAFRPG